MLKSKAISLSLFTDNNEVGITRSQFLIGCAEHADLKIDDKSVSHYHAMITLKDNTYYLQDLGSIKSTFINGNKILAPTPFYEGDKVTFGSYHWDVLESSQKFTIEELDSHIEKSDETQVNKIPVPKKKSETEILIDNEYCDIIFEDSQSQSNSTPLASYTFNAEGFIALDEIESDSFEITQDSQDECLQVTTMLSGIILEQYYFPLQDGAVLGSSSQKKGHVHVESLNDFEGALARIEHGLIKLTEVESFTNSLPSAPLSQQLSLHQSQGPYQIFYKVSKAPNKIIDISSLKRDKDFYKDTTKKFAAVMLPLLLLLLIDFTLPKEEKKLTIIYKKPTQAKQDNKKLASTDPTKTDKNTGHKKTKQSEKKISHNKKGEQKQAKKAPQKVATSKPAPKKNTKAKVKTYDFKMASNVKSLFSNSKSVSQIQDRSVASVNTASAVNSQNLDTSVTGTSQAQVGNLGSDSAGKQASFGSRGLSGRKGRDTAYIQTKTVVLGSMDPELLRKILQQYLPQFRHCYQQELVYNSEDIKGIVDLNFEISGGGKVGNISIKAKDSRFSKKGTNCMADVLAIIDFPKPKGGGRVAVRQPLSFFSEQEKG